MTAPFGIGDEVKKKAGRNSHRPSSISLDNGCQYIRGQPLETDVISLK